MTRVIPGRTYGTVVVNGRRVRVEVPRDHADRWMCRRTVDFAPAPIPADAGFAPCTECGSELVFNPATPAPTCNLPKVCMQCECVEPLSFEVVS